MLLTLEIHPPQPQPQPQVHKDLSHAPGFSSHTTLKNKLDEFSHAVLGASTGISFPSPQIFRALVYGFQCDTLLMQRALHGRRMCYNSRQWNAVLKGIDMISCSLWQFLSSFFFFLFFPLSGGIHSVIHFLILIFFELFLFEEMNAGVLYLV